MSLAQLIDRLAAGLPTQHRVLLEEMNGHGDPSRKAELTRRAVAATQAGEDWAPAFLLVAFAPLLARLAGSVALRTDDLDEAQQACCTALLEVAATIDPDDSNGHPIVSRLHFALRNRVRQSYVRPEQQARLRLAELIEDPVDPNHHRIWLRVEARSIDRLIVRTLGDTQDATLVRSHQLDGLGDLVDALDPDAEPEDRRALYNRLQRARHRATTRVRAAAAGRHR